MKVPFYGIQQQNSPLYDEIRADIEEVFKTSSFVEGPAVKKFERSVEEYLGSAHAVTCGNGTDALMLALRACSVNPGDEVITSPFSFFATAEAIAAVGAVPVFVDIRNTDYLIDPDKIEEAITDKTKAIIPVHIFGCCCDMDRINEIAHRHGLKVIEDAAQAIGSEYKGRKAGTLGDIGCFSFYPTKNLGGCGDGGMCTTNSDDLETILRAVKAHGSGEIGAKAREILGGGMGEASGTEFGIDYQKYHNHVVGYNSRLDSLQAVCLSAKLKKIDLYNKRRDEIAEMYSANLPINVKIPLYDVNTKPCWHQFAIRTSRKKGLSRFLTENGVGNAAFYQVPLHKQAALVGKCRVPDDGLPVAEKVCSETVCLPIYPELTDEQAMYVIEKVRDFFKGENHELLRTPVG